MIGTVVFNNIVCNEKCTDNFKKYNDELFKNINNAIGTDVVAIKQLIRMYDREVISINYRNDVTIIARDEYLWEQEY